MVKKVSVKRDNNKEEFKVLDPENPFEEKIKKIKKFLKRDLRIS